MNVKSFMIFAVQSVLHSPQLVGFTLSPSTESNYIQLHLLLSVLPLEKKEINDLTH